MKSLLRFGLVTLAAFCLCSCFGAYSKHYRPEGEQETELFAKARRDVYPNDVRENLKAFDGQLLLWTGIVQSVGPTEDGKHLRMKVEHHYWDWIEDHSIQPEIAFLSPRGEGLFACDYRPNSKVEPDEVARVGDMAIVYGMPKELTASGMILMACPFYKTLRRELYATDIFSYGRDFSDLKVLRVPGVDD